MYMPLETDVYKMSLTLLSPAGWPMNLLVDT